MSNNLIRAGIFALAVIGAIPPVVAQAPVPVSPPPANQPAPIYSPEQLDQLLAPIALYPDPLLAQVLMASTYPLEVVEAERWAQDPNYARLRGDQLAAALEPQDWDPSVKSLVPFPQVLQMMSSRLDWMQQVGNAFLAQQADVMDSIQRLRAEAQAAGTLQSAAQEVVTTQGPQIIIEPANPQVVYVPYYDPRIVYGAWGYPDYPPIYFPPPYGYTPGPGIFFGIGVAIVTQLWGWDDWDWGHRYVRIDADRYNVINNYYITRYNRPRYTANTWQHDPYHRRDVPYRDAASRQRFQASTGAAPGGSPETRRDYRGYGAGQQANAPTPTTAQRPPATGRAPTVQGPAGGPRPTTTPTPSGAQRPSPGPQVPAPQPTPTVQGPTGGQRPTTTTTPSGAQRPSPGPQPSTSQHVPAAPRPTTAQRPVTPTVQRTPAAVTPPVHPTPQPPPAYGPITKAPDVRSQADRGRTSRQSTPSPTVIRTNAPTPSSAPPSKPTPSRAPAAASPPPRTPPGNTGGNKQQQR